MPTDDGASQRIEALERTVARLTVQQALMDERLLTLEQNRLFRWWGQVYRGAAGIYARLGLGKRYGGLSDLRTPGDYARWVAREQQELAAEDHRACAAGWRSQPLISVRLTGNAGTAGSVQSVLDQCYSKWELWVPAALSDVTDPRIRIGEPAAGEFVLTLHAGDRLSPHALYFYAQALQDEAVTTVYADEDCIEGEGNRSQPVFKPGWSPELLRSTMYLGRAVLKRGESLGSSGRVQHIPRVLYHRMKSTAVEYTRPQYTAPADARLSVIICSREVRRVRECLEAVRYTAKVSMEFLVVHHVESGTGDEMRECVEQLGGTWIPYRGPFDFARMNNMAAAKSTAPYLLFLNDDVIVQEPGWDQALAATLAREEIGIAGAVLEYPNGTVQHAGVVVGMGDAAGHCGRFQMSSELWPWLRMSRDVTAVTGAMLGIRSEVFQKLDGFDEAFPVNYNDVDLCLRVREAGLRVVCLDVGKVVHRESQTRVGGTRYEEREALYKRWARILARPDEFYSPHLAAMERIALDGGTRPLRELA